MCESVAFLSNYDDYTTFTFRDLTITFLTGKSLKRYTKVKEWKSGYLVVECEKKDATVEEDYIDLIPILENLLIAPEDFLKDVKEVQLSYVSR